MKKSELREMIKKELLKEGYVREQILQALDDHEDSVNPESPLAMKIRGGNGDTKWFDISKLSLEKFAKFAK